METPWNVTTEELSTWWDAALPWADYLASVSEKRDIWEANARRASLHADESVRLQALPGPRRLLVLTEDWCGDAARSVPVMAALAEGAPLVTVRFLPSDGLPEILGRHLTHGGRSIPLAFVLDGEGRRLGEWGPRPAPVQALFRQRRHAMGAPTPDTMNELYQPVMAFYGKDRGRTTVQELLMLLERGGAPR